ncbi:MAG TPA: globin domain-containing protein [Kineosporiaceae bacterium]
MVDVPALRRSFGAIAEHGDEVPLYFYSYLFLREPRLRGLFPPGMAAMRDRLVGALAKIVSDVDDLGELVPFLEHLGRDHRKFQVAAEHYPLVGEALLATLEHFLGPAWTPHLATEWAAAYGVVADVMIKSAATDAEAQQPAWWDAQIVRHERRAPDLAVITVQPDVEVPYQPGQSVSLQHDHRPRLWRYYSPANAPRPDRTLEFHVRAVDGGWVSSSLVASAGPGDSLQLGSAVGELVLDRQSDDDLLMVAGGTGLAPLRAMIEQLAAPGAPRRRTHLYVEARTETDHYDLAVLDRLAAAHPWLTVVPVARCGRVHRCYAGRAADVALRQSSWTRHQVYVCGSPGMVAETRDLLLQAGIDPTRIRHESFGYRTGPTSRFLTPPVRREGDPPSDDLDLVHAPLTADWS